MKNYWIRERKINLTSVIIVIIKKSKGDDYNKLKREKKKKRGKRKATQKVNLSRLRSSPTDQKQIHRSDKNFHITIFITGIKAR